MKYEKFKEILNKKIFEESKAVLLEKISKNPNRFIGLFRPTKPKAKIIQNLTQSNEIKFGDAFEILIEEYFREKGFEILNRKYVYNDKDLDIDQHFSDGKNEYFIEQKIRDDHDSTKKVGQMDNFENKLNVLLDNKLKKEIIGIVYFIDPDMRKNERYYEERIKQIKKDYGVEIKLFYGSELFEYFNLDWDEVLKYLKEWKKEIPDIPEINFDNNAKETFEEIKNLEVPVFRKLFSNDDIFNEIILTLFPEKKVLKMLLKFFGEKSEERRYQTLIELLGEKLK